MNLVVYGSLLNKEELKKHNINLDKIEYVKVYGFKRVFNQLPSWREVKGNKKAVLNIKKDRDSWFNAILIKDLDESYFRELDIRERGYNRVKIEDLVVGYNGEVFENCFVYCGKEGMQSDLILPNEEYFKICYEGAKGHFEEFFKDYIKTTYMNSKEGLKRIEEKS
ncbi:MAG: gamma-glutamylcyclotransferase [Epsilonproteobacteria bacterium]|nr:gamma-glutamylcyclotransferase [Campylobacterota bacterium]